MRHIWGIHHLAYHLEQADWEHIGRMEYRSAKVFEWMWSSRAYVDNLLAAMPHDAVFLARDYPLSEQHSDMERDPVGTGKRHADDWAEKVRSGKCLLPPTRTYFLGLNEVHVWSHLQQAVDYNVAFLRRLGSYGLRGGALNLSVGWPATRSGQPDGLPDWTPYKPVHDAIVATNSLLILHEYAAHDNHGWGYWLMRLQHCPWQDVQIIIGECGIDEAVIPGKEHLGWQHFMDAQAYCAWLDEYHKRLTADRRIHSAMGFTYDFSRPWGSFDTRPARQTMEQYNWGFAKPQPVQPPTPPPTPPTPPTPPVEGDTWQRALAWVERWEGEYQNNPADIGNWTGCAVGKGENKGTKYGISACSYPHLDIINLTREQARNIYRRDYWQASGADQLPWPLCLLVFDSAVLHGVGTARQWLDKVGPNPYLFAAYRLRVYTRLANWSEFGKGWVNRVADLLEAMQ